MPSASIANNAWVSFVSSRYEADNQAQQESQSCSNELFIDSRRLSMLKATLLYMCTCVQQIFNGATPNTWTACPPMGV